MSNRKILLLGASGCGKTYSLRNLPAESTFFINVDMKELPIRGWKTKYKSVMTSEGKLDPKQSNLMETRNYSSISRMINYVDKNRPEIKYIVIDTITLMQVASYMDRGKEPGWDKFTDFANEVWVICKSADKLREDLTFIMCAHTDEVDVKGVKKTKFAVPGGNLVREKLKPESLFTIVLETKVERDGDESNYYYITNNDGYNSAKSPPGMFEFKEPNEIMSILEKAEAYDNSIETQ